MKVENKFEVKEEDNNIVVYQTIVKTMDIKESIVELNKLKAEHHEVSKKITELQEYINKEQPLKDLEAMQGNDDVLKELETKWEEASKHGLALIKEAIKHSITKEKLDRGYLRLEDGNEKYVLKANIIGRIAMIINLILITR
jgi:hypothetical protein